MTPINSTNDQNILCVELFEATITHYQSKYVPKKIFETALGG